MESATCRSSCSVALRYLVRLHGGAIHGHFPLRRNMNTMILRVKKCGQMTTVQSEKSENGVLDKRTLVLQELGGKYENCYVVTALGSLATIEWSEGEIVACALSFRTHEHNGQVYMDVIANEMYYIKH